MIYRRKKHVATAVLAAGSLFFSSFLNAAGVPMESQPFQWIRNGEAESLPLIEKEGKRFLEIEQLARLSTSEVTWNPAKKQVTLSNHHGHLTFDWKRKSVSRSLLDATSLSLVFENNHLLVPMDFVLHPWFGQLSKSELSYQNNPDRLVQQTLINLKVHAVERLTDRYRLVIETPPDFPHYLVEQSDQKIWIRFVGAVSEGSQILNGDSVIERVNVVQRRQSADVIVAPGPDARDNDVFFEEGKKRLVIDVFTIPDLVVSPPPTEAPVQKKKAKAVAARPTKSKPVARAVVPVKKLDIKSRVTGPAVAATVPVAVPTEIESNESKTTTTRTSHTPSVMRARDEKRVVVIDAGHGGVDSGAIGPRGTLEKDINLAVAKELTKRLSKEKGYTVMMTRSSDEFIALSERTEIANKNKADLFVSIHCNSSLSAKTTGSEVYVLAVEASDQAAASAARLENSVLALEGKKHAGDNRLSQLLASMAVNQFINESSHLAGNMSRTLRERLSTDNASVKEANFYVLRGTQMPAVLVELEYVSNPISELKLRSTRYQAKLVKGIVDGLLAYERSLQNNTTTVASQYREALIDVRP